MVQDSIQRFIFENTDIRGEIVRLNATYCEILSKHHYPSVIKNILGEALIAACLLSATLKYDGQLTIQFQSQGTLKLLVAKCNQNNEIRALAQYDETALLNNDNLFINGQLVVTIEPDNKVKPYQSIIPLTENSIAANIENYFGQSVQIPTKIMLATAAQQAVAVLLQLLPNQTQSSEDRENFWQHAVHLAETLKSEELLQLSNETILHRLYHQEILRLFEPQPVSFVCQCSLARMESVVKMLGQPETDDIFKTKQIIDITCEYCNKVYSFDRIDVAKILHP